MSSCSEGCHRAAGLPCLEHPSPPSTSTYSQGIQQTVHDKVSLSSNFGSTFNWPPDGPQLLPEYLTPTGPPLTGPARLPETRVQIDATLTSASHQKRLSSHLERNRSVVQFVLVPIMQTPLFLRLQTCLFPRWSILPLPCQIHISLPNNKLPVL
jgi:hypothetical protein